MRRFLSNLLTDGAISIFLQSVQLISLPQQRVEGLGCAMHCGGVRGDRKGRHQAHLLQRRVAAGRSVQKLAVLQILSQTLQHRQRLIEVYLQRRTQSQKVSYKWSGWFHIHTTNSCKSMCNKKYIVKQAFTGMGILDKSLPIQFFMMLQRLRE